MQSCTHCLALHLFVLTEMLPPCAAAAAVWCLQPQKRGNFVVGNFTLPQTKPGEVWEVKLELTRNGAHMQPVIKALDTLFFRRVVGLLPAALLSAQLTAAECTVPCFM